MDSAIRSRAVLQAAKSSGEATEAGAEFVGGDEMVQKIIEGWTDLTP